MNKKSIKELVAIINLNAKKVTNEDLKKKMVALSNRVNAKEKVRKSEFVDLVTEMQSSLGDDFEIPAPVVKAENSQKVLKKSAKKQDLADSTMFPEVLNIGDNDYKLCSEVKTEAQFRKSVQNGDSFIFAFYWSKRLLKQFEYAGGEFSVPEDGFKDDLDIATPIYLSDAGTVTYAISAVTESLYQVMPDHFNEEDGIRFCRGIEFQLYKMVEASK